MKDVKLEIADILLNEKKKLIGFKVLFLFDFYLQYIRVSTHLKLCKIKAKMEEITTEPVEINLFNNPDIQTALIPLIKQYCLIGLLNDRVFGWFFYPFLAYKINQCSYFHLLNIYATIYKFNEPAFFLTIYKLIQKVPENTLLKEEKPS